MPVSPHYVYSNVPMLWLIDWKIMDQVLSFIQVAL